jgi:cell division protein ZapA
LKQVEVTILGQSYLLGCPDGGEKALLEAVASVDREMCAIRDGGKVKARERIAVLAALNLAFALAERGDAPAAAAAAGNGRGDASTRSSVDLAQLIKRLDMALGADGQLL